VQLANRSIYDIAATVLAVAGVPTPPDLDGHPFLFYRVAEMA
jgi:hypothetical protein